MAIKSTQQILPFPQSIDHDSFGHWLSGFTDGEACFYLGCAKTVRPLRNCPSVYHYNYAKFRIQLRADEFDILQSIQSYWNCGTIHFSRKSGGINDQVAYSVSRIKDLFSVVVPHFCKYALHAKKRHDFAIWKDGIDILYKINLRRSGHTRFSKWQKSEKEKYAFLVQLLNSGRKYKNPFSLPHHQDENLSIREAENQFCNTLGVDDYLSFPLFSIP